MTPASRVVSVTLTDDTLSADIDDGRTISVPIGWYPRLANGTPAERANFQISGAGYGIHWPELERTSASRGCCLGRSPRKTLHHFKIGCNGANRLVNRTEER